jgi:hypothetical protein
VAARASRPAHAGRVASLGLLLAVLLLGCTGDVGPKRANGLIVNVKAASFTQIAQFDVRTDDGRTLSFAVEGDVGFTPSHLRQHMVLAEPVTVTYRETANGPVATLVEDRIGG